MFPGFFERVLGIIIAILPHIDGTVRFTQVPPSVLYVSNGGTAKFVWDYHVDDRDNEFYTSSPEWSFINNTNNHTTLIAAEAWTFENGGMHWKWSVAPSCPARLQNRVSKESTATLVINKVTTLDNGNYSCKLVLSGGKSPIERRSTLIVTVRPSFNIHPPSPIVVSEASNLAVPCSANGQPTPNVIWVRIQTVISRGLGSSTLSIPNIKRNQDGKYECRATNNPNESPISAQTDVVVQYPPSFTIRPIETIVTKGDRITLTCRANGNPTPTISWSKEGGAIKPGHRASDTLIIPDADKNDAGKYICTARNTYKLSIHSTTASAFVIVKYGPSIVSKSPNQVINETNSLRLTCNADGYPSPNITWTKSSGFMTPSDPKGTVYSILSAKRSDAGTYTCRARNGIESDVLASIQVIVQYKAEIMPSKSTKTTDSWNGKLITLRCSYTGTPVPLVTWYRPSGAQIAAHLAKVTYEGPALVSELNITTKNGEDYGKYSCVVTNVVGNDALFININQLFIPFPPQQSNTISDSKGTQITIFWCVPDVKGGTSVIDYKVEINTNPPQKFVTKDTFIVLKDLKENTNYVVKVSARNKAGYGDPVQRTIVTTNPENHMTFIMASLVTILVISLLANVLFTYTFFKAQREEKRLRNAKRSSPKSYENKSEIEKDSGPSCTGHSLTNVNTDGCVQKETSERPVTEDASHYQSLSSATRRPKEATPPRLYEPLQANVVQAEQSQYVQLQLKNRAAPETKI